MPKSVFSREYEAFRKLLRQSRETRGVSQVEMARILKITQSSVSKIERGERRLDVVELWQWCNATGASFEGLARELDRLLSGKR